MSLTKLQKEELNKLSYSQWRSSYEMKVGLGTLQELVHKGYAESKHELGAMSMPFTCILFRRLHSRKIKRRNRK